MDACNGKMGLRHGSRVKAEKAHWREINELMEAATRPSGPPPFVMELRSFKGDPVQRFLPYRRYRAR